MPPSIRAILQNPAFSVRVVSTQRGAPAGAPDGALDEPLSWVHSSDLADPTEFLEPGQLLLTDGAQFPQRARAQEYYDAYVERLADLGIRGLGFATAVIHPQIPPRLISACERAGMPLLEVSNRTPFIAIIRFISAELSREQLARVEWSLNAQRAISRAALRPDGLRSILAELEKQLGCWVLLFDAAGNRVPFPTRHPIPGDLVDSVADAARQALKKGTRSASRQSGPQEFTLQTLGGGKRLRGALALGTSEAMDPAGADLLGSVIGLASLALEQNRALDNARRHLRAGLLEQLLAGDRAVADRTAEKVWGRLPEEPITVSVVRDAQHGDHLLEALELESDEHRGGVFYAQRNDHIVAIAGEKHGGDLRELFAAHRATVGSSTPVRYAELGRGVTEAERALARAVETGADGVGFTELLGDGMLGLLGTDRAAAVARGVLLPVVGHDAREGTALVPTLRAWISNNCAWEPTAQQLGIHRHTLRNRIDLAGTLLGLDLDLLQDRLELWAAVQFTD